MSDELSDDEREKLLNNFKQIHSTTGKGITQGDTALRKDTKTGGSANISAAQKAYTPTEAAGRGAMSGALMGWQPQIAGAIQSPFSDKSYSELRDESARLNDKAFEQQPLSYGAGYGGGALGTTVLTGGLADAALGTSMAANTARSLDAAKHGFQIISDTGRAGNFLRAGANTAANLKSAPGAIAKGIQGGVGTIGNAENTAPNAPPPSRSDERANDIQPTPLSNFERLKSWLSSQASSEEDKRKLAMQMSSTPEGRSQSNDDTA